MKLHLPNGLRKALLACLASLVLPATLPTTVASASGFAAVWIMAAQQVAAKDSVLIERKQKPGANQGGENSYNAALESSNTNNYEWLFDVAPDINFNFGVDSNQQPKHLADFVFKRDLTVNNGYSGKVVTFEGTISTAGDAVGNPNLIFKSWGGGVTNTWVFNGHLDGFRGDILITAAGTLNVEFGEGVRTNTGAIRQDAGTLNLTINDGVTMKNSEVSVNNITVNTGSSSFTTADAVNGTNVTAAGTLTLGTEGGTEEGTGVQMTLSGVTLKARDVVLRKDTTLTLEAYEDGGSIKRSVLDWINFNPGSYTLTVKLSDLTDAMIGVYGSDQYGYALFGGGWTGGNGHIVLEAQTKSKRKLKLNESGRIVYDGTDFPSLTWTASRSNNTLEWLAGEWDNKQTYDPGDPAYPDVYFEGSGGTVKIDGEEVHVVHANIGKNSSGEFHFEYTGVSAADGTLDVQGVIYVEEGSTLFVGDNLTVSVGIYTGGGALGLDGGTFEIRDMEEDTNPDEANSGEKKRKSVVIGELIVTEKGGTLKVGANDADAEKRVTVNTAVDGAEGDLQIEGSGEGGIRIQFAEGGALKSLTQVGAEAVNIELHGKLTLAEGGKVGGKLDFAKSEGETNPGLVLGGDLTVGGGLSNILPEDATGLPCDITSTAADAVTLTIGGDDIEVEDWEPTVTGDITIGSYKNFVNLVKRGEWTQKFVGGKVDIWGDVTIEDGELHIENAVGEQKGEIHGALSGDGKLVLSNGAVTLSGPSAQVGTLRFAGSTDDVHNVLELTSDLVVGEIVVDSNMGGTIQRAEGGGSFGTLYVLLDPHDAGLITMEGFLDRLHRKRVVNGVETGEITYGDDIKIGKGGDGELRLQAGSNPVEVPDFKLAGSGTLTWVDGDQVIDHFKGEMVKAETTDEEGAEPEIIGPTLSVRGGKLTLGEVSGRLKEVDLTGAQETGRAILALRGGTLRAQTLKGAPGATIELQIGSVPNTGGWLDFGEIEAVGGSFAIRLTGEKETSIQLFANDEQWIDQLKEQLVGEGGTGYAWTDFFRIEMDRALLEEWGVTDANELKFQLTGDGVLKIKAVDYLDWSGSEEDVWSSTGTEGWGLTSPEGKDLRFTEGQGSSVVNIGGVVTPKNVDIESGEFTFQSAPGVTAGGLDMPGDEEGNGVLHIHEGAVLHLNLQNRSIYMVNLEGTLGLGHTGALPEGTHVQFNGGMLLYDTDGVAPDVSRFVDRDSAGPIRVAVDDKVAGGVTWGSRDAEIGENTGLNMALNGKGLEKSDGGGNFTLAWSDDGAEHKGNLSVVAGTLTLDVGGAGSANMSGNITGTGTLVVGGSSKVTLSGNNTVKGIVLGQGTSTHLKGKTALGGAETVLTLAGGTLTGDPGAEAQAGTVEADADTTVSVVTLTGAVTGSGALIVEDGKSAGLAGDLSGYTGELKTGTSGTWKLSGGALGKEVDAAVSGSGTVQFDGGGTFGGELRGHVTLRGNNGELTVVTQESEAVGATLAGTVALGNADKQAEWWDTAVADDSTIYLSNVDLRAETLEKGNGTKLYVRTATSKTRPENGITVNVNGMDAGELDGITINGHGQLQGIAGEYQADSTHGLELHFARENVENGGVSGGTADPAASLSAASGEATALIEGGEGGFTLESKDDTGRKIWLDSDAVSEILTIMAQAKEEGQKATAILHLLEQGTLTMGGLTLEDLLGDEVQILRSLDTEFEVDEANGNLVLKGSAADVFVAFAGKTELDNGTFLDQAKATVLSDETTDFTLNLDGATHAGNEPDVTVHNLLGLTGSMLHLQNSNADKDANRLTVAFDNTQADEIKDPSKYPTVDGTTVHGQHTTYNGSIDAGNGVDVTKVGYGTLTVGGTYMLADGTTTIREGALRLRGGSNAMEGLTFDYREDAQQTGLGEENRGLLLEGGTTTVRGAISDEGEVGKGDIKLSNAELILNGQSTLEGTSITSEDGTGKLTLKKAEGAAEGTPDPSLTLSGEKVKAVLSGVDVDVQAGLLKLQKGATMTGGSATIGDTGTLDFGDGARHELSSLKGSGVLKSASGGEVRVGGESSFSGKLDSSEKDGKAGTLIVAAGANFTLSNVTTTATNTANGWGITVEGSKQDGTPGGNLTIDVSGKAAGEQLTLGAVSLGSGSTTTIKLNTETYNAEEKSTIVGSSLSFADDVSIVLETDEWGEWDYNRELTLGMYDEVTGDVTKLKDRITLKQGKPGSSLLSDVQDVEVDENGRVTVTFQKSNGRKLLDAIPNGAKNAQAGARMIEGSLSNKTSTPGSDYARVVEYVTGMYDSGSLPNIQGQLSAVAGASVSILGPALSEDLHRQLGSIRNRTTTMANEVTQETVGRLPLWHAWINAEGNYHKMDEDSLAPGYTLNSWGGTVGADADLTPRVTVGLAITAMYGDLDADAPDTATGDMDTSYLSAFVRATRGAWIHTFVVSGGIANVKLNRTVNFGGDSYTAHGDTDGYAFGAMYEVGYTGLVNKRGTAALQPVFNVEVRHVAINGYAETGSDAGVDVDDIDRTVVTFGAGVRAQAAVATNAFNRTSVLESRLLLKLDVGDRSGTASNAIVGDKTRAEVESAEVGEVGVEFGAGISVPLGSDLGSVFLDGSVEYREGWTSANATLGYRVTF